MSIDPRLQGPISPLSECIFHADPASRFIRIVYRKPLDLASSTIDLPFVAVKQMALAISNFEVQQEAAGLMRAQQQIQKP